MPKPWNTQRIRWLSGWWLVSSLLCGAAIAAEPAAPPPPSTPSAGESADSLIDEAVRQRRNGDDASARQVLARARQLAPGSTRVLVHLASVEQALGNWVAAKLLLVETLRRPGDGYVERNRSMLRDALDGVAAHLGEITLQGSPPGARVRFDGRAIGTLPLPTGLEVAAGRHVLEVDADGYFPLARSIEVVGRERRSEVVELLRQPAPVDPALLAEDAPQRSGVSILTWSLAGAGTLAAIGGAIAWGVRESHVRKWNGDECLPFGSTRERRCGGERDAAERYQALAITGGAAALLLGGGAALSAWLADAPSPAPTVGLQGCSVLQLGLACHGRF